MDEHEWLAEQFEANRTHLQAVAYRMLGRLDEADDAVQESWLRLSRSDASDIANLGGWLTTVVARICLDMLRARNARREESLEAAIRTRNAARTGSTPSRKRCWPTRLAWHCSWFSTRCSPAERLAFVLHDIFAMPFDEIAPIVDRSETATRQLASRAPSGARRSNGLRDTQRDNHISGEQKEE